jgi:DNA polymerase-2
MEACGFILQASYRIRENVPVVHLYGCLENGESFLVRDRRLRPYFYVPAAAGELAMAAGAHSVRDSDRRTFTGEPVVRVEVAVPGDAPNLRDRLHAQGVATYEADVRFAIRYLIDRNIRGGCLIRGAATSGPATGEVHGQNIHWVFDEPELESAEVTVTPRVLAFDIETDPAADRLLAISLYSPLHARASTVVDEVLIVDPDHRQMPEKAIGYPDERAVLEAFCRRISELDPDVLTGWNVIDFDLSVLAKVAARVRHPLPLGREPGAMRIRPAQGYFGSGHANIPGRLVLDGIDLTRGAFMRFDDFSLDAVARSVLGEGKALEGDVKDRVGEIIDRYRHDLNGFARYARTDARLALQILEKLDLVHLAFTRSALTGMTPDRVAASIASFDFLYLAALNERRIVAPTVGSDDSRVYAAQAGGEVFEPVIGMHDYVWVFDFKSLYPSVMRTFNIDPLGFVATQDLSEADIRLVNDVGFRREPAILPGMLDMLFPQREAAKKNEDEVASQAIKILMNSFYGVLGTPACRFHNPDIANAITGQGRHFLQWTRDWFENKGYEVLYGDTDSVFVASGMNDVARIEALGATLATALSEELADYIQRRWRVASRLELEFEKLYTKLFLPSVRHGVGGARKRYAGLRTGQDAQAVEFVGMEVVRRDWTELAKEVQRELYARLFAGEPVVVYLAEIVSRVRAGALDAQLVYRKGLRKTIDSYTANTPPHVVAARKLPSPPPRVISYVITTNGPEPLAALEHEPDREHYVEKQVKPVAEPVLGALGLDFAKVIGDDRQLGLF